MEDLFFNSPLSIAKGGRWLKRSLQVGALGLVYPNGSYLGVKGVYNNIVRGSCIQPVKRKEKQTEKKGGIKGSKEGREQAGKGGRRDIVKGQEGEGKGGGFRVKGANIGHLCVDLLSNPPPSSPKCPKANSVGHQ